MRTCPDGCGRPAACQQHLSALVAIAGADVEPSELRAMLIDELTIVAGASARAELEQAASVLRERMVLSKDASLDPSGLGAASATLHPLAAGVAMIVAARARGVALGLLADRKGRLALAHAGLADPLVIGLKPGAPLVDVDGASSGLRWVCAHGLAALAARQSDAAAV